MRYRLRANSSTCSFRWPVMKISSLMSSPSSRSMTQSITGRPATRRRGLGTMWVCGRSRVPLPASGMITCISASSVTVFEPHEVVELGRRSLEHVAVHNGLDLMDLLGWDVHRLTGLEWPSHHGIAPSDAKLELTAQDVHGLILQVVVLKAEHVPRFDVKDLAHIALRAGPDQLVTPGLLHSIRYVRHSVSHDPGVKH